MMNLLAIALAMLATYRAARMLAQEDGPFDLFSSLRDWAGQRNWIGRGLHCPLCIGFWIALPAALLCEPPTLMWLVLAWMGIAGGQVVLQRLFG